MYDSAVVTLSKYFNTACNLVVECHHFHCRFQSLGESVQEYVTVLPELATMCLFISQEESLWDQSVAGVSSHHIREYLLLEGSSLSFNKADLGSQIEHVAGEMKQFSICVQPASAYTCTQGCSSEPSPHSQPCACTFGQHDKPNKAAMHRNRPHLERAVPRICSNKRILPTASDVALTGIMLHGHAAP